MIFSPPFARILQPSNVFDNRNLISDLSIEDGGESSVRAGKGLKWRQATFRVSRNSFRTLHTLVEHNERVESMKSAHECDFQSAACELDYIILQQAALRGILVYCSILCHFSRVLKFSSLTAQLCSGGYFGMTLCGCEWFFENFCQSLLLCVVAWRIIIVHISCGEGKKKE